MLLNLVCFFSVPRGSTESRLERVGTGLNTHRLIASRKRSCSWSVHDSLDLVIVYGLRVLLASACFIVHVPSLPRFLGKCAKVFSAPKLPVLAARYLTRARNAT